MSVKEPKRVAKTEVKRVFEQGVRDNDLLRQQGLQRLMALRSSKAKLQAREENRLQTKYDARHPRTVQAAARLDANADTIGALRMENRRATAPREKPDARTWAVQGHVYDRRGCPLAGIEVALYAGNGQRVDALPAVTTDNKGYYKLAHRASAQQLSTGESAGLGTAAGDTGGQGTGSSRLSGGLRINRNVATNASVFVRAQDRDDETLCADSTLMRPQTGVCNYRDLILDVDVSQRLVSDVEKDRRSSRYLGNSSNRELHDLKNEKSGCQIDEIRIDRCVRFKSIAEAEQLGYDFCAYCFGRARSRR